jgi:methylamine dehydrogenase accessory protein MauD
MNEVLAASVVLLWLVVIALAVAVIALARQIGVLHGRLAPAGALMTNAGPKVGETVPRKTFQSLDGTPALVGGTRERPQLLLFVSPTCPICRTLVPTARSLARSERLDLVFASDGGDPAAHAAYVEKQGIGDHPYVISTELGLTFEVGKLPYAVLLDARGVLRSKGLVNSREHLESLVEAMLSGYESIQDYLYRDATLEPREAS